MKLGLKLLYIIIILLFTFHMAALSSHPLDHSQYERLIFIRLWFEIFLPLHVLVKILTGVSLFGKNSPPLVKENLVTYVL